MPLNNFDTEFELMLEMVSRNMPADMQEFANDQADFNVYLIDKINGELALLRGCWCPLCKDLKNSIEWTLHLTLQDPVFMHTQFGQDYATNVFLKARRKSDRLATYMAWFFDYNDIKF